MEPGTCHRSYDNNRVILLFQFVLGEPELNARSDADFLLRYLRFTNLDEVRAHKIIKGYYKHRARYPKIFDQLTPTNVAEDFSRHLVSVLPERDNHGQPVLLVRIGKTIRGHQRP